MGSINKSWFQFAKLIRFGFFLLDFWLHKYINKVQQVPEGGVKEHFKFVPCYNAVHVLVQCALIIEETQNRYGWSEETTKRSFLFIENNFELVFSTKHRPKAVTQYILLNWQWRMHCGIRPVRSTEMRCYDVFIMVEERQPPRWGKRGCNHACGV